MQIRSAPAYFFHFVGHCVAPNVAIDRALHEGLLPRLASERLSFLAEVCLVDEIIQDQRTRSLESYHFDGKCALSRMDHLHVNTRGFGSVHNALNVSGIQICSDTDSSNFDR